MLVRDHGAYIWGADIWEAKRHTEVYHFLFEAWSLARSRPVQPQQRRPAMTDTATQHDPFLCPTCQQSLPHTKIDVVDVAAAVEADKLTDADVFKRTYIGHGKHVERVRLPGPRRAVPDGTSTSPTTRSATC